MEEEQGEELVGVNGSVRLSGAWASSPTITISISIGIGSLSQGILRQAPLDMEEERGEELV